MTYAIVILPGASRDIATAAQWIEEQSASASKALKFVLDLRAKIETLRRFPAICPVDPDSDAYGEEVRVLLFGKGRGKYRVLFSIRGETVYVHAVRHSARQDLPNE